MSRRNKKETVEETEIVEETETVEETPVKKAVVKKVKKKIIVDNKTLKPFTICCKDGSKVELSIGRNSKITKSELISLQATKYFTDLVEIEKMSIA